MLKLRAKVSDGMIVFLGSPDIPPAPNADGPVSELDFDGETNAALAGEIGANPSRFRLLAGVLTRDGVTVNLAADGENETVRKQAQQMVNDFTAWLGLPKPTTNAQKELVLDRLARSMRYMIKREFGL